MYVWDRNEHGLQRNSATFSIRLDASTSLRSLLRINKAAADGAAKVVAIGSGVVAHSQQDQGPTLDVAYSSGGAIEDGVKVQLLVLTNFAYSQIGHGHSGGGVVYAIDSALVPHNHKAITIVQVHGRSGIVVQQDVSHSRQSAIRLLVIDQHYATKRLTNGGILRLGETIQQDALPADLTANAIGEVGASGNSIQERDTPSAVKSVTRQRSIHYFELLPRPTENGQVSEKSLLYERGDELPERCVGAYEGAAGVAGGHTADDRNARGSGFESERSISSGLKARRLVRSVRHSGQCSSSLIYSVVHTHTAK